MMLERNYYCKTYDEKIYGEKKLILIIYDIVDNKRRTKFYNYLSGYMIPVQKSCFESHLSDMEFNKLIKKIDRYIDKEEDNVRCYKLSSFGKVYNFGKNLYQPIEEIIIL